MSSQRNGAIILAAGASTRLGHPKQLIRIGNENLVERSVRVALAAGCSPVIVVLGARADHILASSQLNEAQVVKNEIWAEGMSTSISAGIAVLGKVDGVVLMTCDMPAVTSEHLRSLMKAETLGASAYAGRLGVPAYLPESMFPLLSQLQGDHGAQKLLRNARAVPLEGGECDIDTQADEVQALHLFND